MLRKMVAQVGVFFFIFSLLMVVSSPLFIFLSVWVSILPIIFSAVGTILLAFAAILPSSQEEEWGSMWPLVGYDNAIDALYVRGPWLTRFEELEEQERQDEFADGMSRLFGAV